VTDTEKLLALIHERPNRHLVRGRMVVMPKGLAPGPSHKILMSGVVFSEQGPLVLPENSGRVELWEGPILMMPETRWSGTEDTDGLPMPALYNNLTSLEGWKKQE